MHTENIIFKAHVINRPGLDEQVAILRKEVEKRKRNEESLTESQVILHNFIDMSSDGIVIIDEEGRILEWNHAEEAISGLKKSDVIGKYIWDIQFSLLSAEKKNQFSYDQFRSVHYQILNTGVIPEYLTCVEQTLIRPDGTACIFQVKMFTIRTSKGYMIGSTTRDITDRIRMESDLVRSEELYRMLAEAAEDFIFIIGPDLRVIYVNSSAAASLGKSPEQVVGAPLSVLFPEYTIQHFSKNLKNIFETGNSLSDEHFIRFFDKDYWLHVKLTPIKDKTGKITSILGISRDITGRRRIEDTLKKRKREVTTLVDSLPGYAYFKDANGRYLMVNQKMCDSIKTTKEGIIGKTTGDLPQWEYAEKHRTMDEKVIASGQPHYVENIHIDEGGIPKVYSARVIPLKDENNSVTGIVGFTFDVTDLKKAQKALENSKAEAELYVDLLGHDINNINQIARGYLELSMNDPDLNIGTRDMLDRSYDALASINTLIDNVRKLRQMNSASDSYRRIDIGALLLEIKAMYKNSPCRNVTINYAPVDECHVCCSELIRDVFSNIVGNCIKHSRGQVTVDISLAPACSPADRKKYFCVTIDDDGPGIPDSVKDKLLNRQLRSSMRASGSGIGLYLVRNLVENFEGKIWIEDRVPGQYEKGTRFVVMLPAIDGP